MNGYDIQKWQRCEELAELLGVGIDVNEGFRLTNTNGLNLGVFRTVDEVYAFLCGYEHSCKPNAEVTGR